MTKLLRILFILGLVWCAISLGIWLGVYFGVWKPYFDIDWRDTECIVERLEHFSWVTTGKSGTFKNTYTSIHVLVNISSEWVPGFACGTANSKSATLGGASLSGEYPYKAGICPAKSVCGNQVFLPGWYCSECSVCDEKLTGRPTACKWSIGGDSTVEVTPLTRAKGANLPFLAKVGEYIQVVLGEEVYYNKDELKALHALCGAGVAIPLLGIMIVCGLRCWKCRK
jgi:hypothetical protein